VAQNGTLFGGILKARIEHWQWFTAENARKAQKGAPTFIPD
jgi:hypothetical protein